MAASSVGYNSFEDDDFQFPEESGLSDADVAIQSMQERISKIKQGLPLGQVLLTTFPFKNWEGKYQVQEPDFIIQSGLLSLEGKPDDCIDKVLQSKHRLVLIPLVLTTKAIGKEDQQGFFEHWENHIVGVVVDKENKRIEYYESQGKVLENESRRLWLGEVESLQGFIVRLQSALIAEDEQVHVTSEEVMDEFTLISAPPEWPIISNSKRHQGFFDLKTCDYRVTRFFQERILLRTKDAPERLFSSRSPLDTSASQARDYVKQKFEEEIVHLRAADTP